MSILGSLFGEKGLAGGVVDILKSTGIIKDPEMELKAKQVLLEYENKAQELAAKELETINQTMREEAKSEHWMVWSWRPLIGFTFSAVIINNFIFIPYLLKYGLQTIIIPSELWNVMLIVLGVSSATRGLEKWEKVKKQ